MIKEKNERIYYYVLITLNGIGIRICKKQMKVEN